VGQGDAAVIQGGKAAVLVDGGTAIPGRIDLGARAVVPALAALGIRHLDLVIVTHADLDHRGGIPAVLRALPVAEVWLPYGALRTPSFAAVRAAARERGVPVRERGAGSPPVDLGGLRVTPLWPPPGSAQASCNNRSLVVRIDAAGRRVLLPGDLEASAEATLLASGADLRADVLALAHHGSRTSSSSAFLAAVDASVAVVSAPCGGRFGMPHAEVLTRAREGDLSVWWTGRDGAVMVGLGSPFTAFGFADPTAAVPRACGSAFRRLAFRYDGSGSAARRSRPSAHRRSIEAGAAARSRVSRTTRRARDHRAGGAVPSARNAQSRRRGLDAPAVASLQPRGPPVREEALELLGIHDPEPSLLRHHLEPRLRRAGLPLLRRLRER
jgi:competence protein ComEC